MPAALAVDWNEVRTLALAVGVREAARQLEISEDAALQRAHREQWLNKAQQEREKQQEAIAVLRAKQGLSSRVITAADALAITGQNTRAKLAVAVDKQAEQLAETDGQELLIMAPTVKAVVDSAAKLHGWGGESGVSVRLDVIAASASLSVPELPV
jgi:hypothetical protein